MPSPLGFTLPADPLQIPEEKEATESSNSPGLNSVLPNSPGKKHKLETGRQALTFISEGKEWKQPAPNT